MIRVGRSLKFLRVAGIALGRQPLELPCCRAFVARLAVHSRVRADQGEAILVITNRLHGDFPALDGVARFAIRAELPAVNVRMAVRAFLAHIGENQFHVALDALHFFMHATQGISRRVVAEFRNAADGLPTQSGVAVFACNVEGTVGIASSRLLRRALRPLSVGLECEQNNRDL